MHASDEQFDAIYSVVGAIGRVAPEQLVPAITQRLMPGRVLAYSVPLPIARWEKHLSQAGFSLTLAQEFHDSRSGPLAHYSADPRPQVLTAALARP